MFTPISPASARRRRSSRGNSPVASEAAATDTINARQSSRARACTSRWVGVSCRFMRGPARLAPLKGGGTLFEECRHAFGAIFGGPQPGESFDFLCVGGVERQFAALGHRLFGSANGQRPARSDGAGDLEDFVEEAFQG